MKLKRMIAFSRDVILVSLDGEIIPILIDDDRIKNEFMEYSRTLVERVIKDTRRTLEFIDKDVKYDDLEREGLVGGELNFKYAFLNSIISKVNEPETYSPYESEKPFPKLPTLDDYTSTYIMSWGESKSPKRTQIREFIVSLDNLLGKLKTAGGVIKKKVGKVVNVILDGSNKYLDSVNVVIPYLGAVKEIKGFLELGIDAGDSLRKSDN